MASAKKPKKGDVWMPLYISDYLADTTHLSAAQHGAYLLLLMAAWKRGGHVPDDDAQLAQIARTDLKAWRAMRPVIAQFFDIEDGAWTQKRLTAEYAKAGGIVVVRQQAGKAGAAKRWGKQDGEGDGKPIANAMANGIANDKQQTWQADRPSPSPSPKEKTPKASSPTHKTIPAVPEPATTLVPENPGPPDPPPSPPPPPDDPPPPRATDRAVTRAGEIAVSLRAQQIAASSADPVLVAWAEDAVTDDEIREAIAVARVRKPPPARLNAGYLDAVIRATREQAAKPPKRNGAGWWTTEQATLARGRELGLTARGGESWDEFRARIRAAEVRHQTAGAS